MSDFRHKLRAAVGLALVLLAATSTAPAAASPTVAPAILSCGQTLTRSTVMTRDLGPCAGDGIVVGADGITVDLNGHRLLSAPGPRDTVGIRLPRRSRAVIKGGVVRGFAAGVAILGGTRNVVAGVTVQDNVGLFDGSGNFGDGIAIINSSDNVLRANTVRHNGPFDGIGVFGGISTGNQVVGNLVERNNIARFAPPLHLFLNLDDGVNLGAGLDGGHHTNVIGNTIRDNGLNGIDACSIRGNPCITTDDAIVGNLVTGNGFGDPLNPDPGDSGDGIHIVGIIPPGLDFIDFFPETREFVAFNTVLDNAADGIAVGSSNNKILSNRVLGNATSIPDFFFDLQDISLNNDCDSNTWFGNTFATADPACATAGGHRVPVASALAPKTSIVKAPGRPARTPRPLFHRHFPST